jgi:hypothetical protein
MEEENPPTQEPMITLTVPHDAALAIGAAAIHYRAWLQGSAEVAPTIAHLDEVVQRVMQHPQLSRTGRELLRDMRLMVAGQKEYRFQSLSRLIPLLHAYPYL